jgi:hypothetical protein
MLEPLTDDVWTEARPLRFFGLETGTRMTIVRLRSGGLFVHSPVALDDALRAEVDALGPVTAIVAPSRFHHLYVGPWAAAYPGASLSACPGLEKKRKDVSWSRILGDEPAAEWQGELDQVFFGARSLENEVVFFHRASRSIISSDFVFNLATHPSGFTRAVAFLLGQRRPGTTLLERVMIRDRPAAREQIARIAAWGAERIVLAHGDNVAAGGSEVVREAYGWL